MKRLTAIFLSVLMLLILVPTALAAEDTDPPLWKEYGYDSREECIRDWFDGDEDAYQEEVEYALARESWEASMAGEIAAFDADAYWNSGECWQAEYYDSKEAFMEDWLLATEEDFRECLLLRLKNQFDLNLRYTASAAPSTARPVTAPPAGATVIDTRGEEPFALPAENGSPLPEPFA